MTESNDGSEHSLESSETTPPVLQAIDPKPLPSKRRERTPEDLERLRLNREKYFQERQEQIQKIASGEVGVGKVRQHVNPLSPRFQIPCEVPDWNQVT